MTYTVVPDKASGDTFTEANWDTHIKDNLNNGVVRPLIETVLAAAATSITLDLSALGLTMRHLMLEVLARSDRAGTTYDGVMLRFNGDAGNNYDYSEMWAQGNGGTARAYEGIAQSSLKVGYAAGATAPASVAFAATAHIVGYAGTIWQAAVTGQGGIIEAQATGKIAVTSHYGGWRNTSAITSITVLPSVGTALQIGTIATLYGLPTVT